MDFLDIRFWAGTETSLAQYMLIARRILADEGALEASGIRAAYETGKSERPPRLFSKLGNVGVITIAGPLNNSDSWRNEYYGMTGYPEIREALVHAAQDEEVGAIVLDIKSGGGQVSGVSDTADLIRKVDSGVKPVHTFSDGQIASAAYWLGSSARSITIGSVTEAGSVGTLAVHQEMTKMLQDIGITPTVLRSGKFKALGNPYEKLSDLAQETIQAQIDQMSEMFTAYVAERRKVTPAEFDKQMGQGRVFIGQQAVDIGLVDKVDLFDNVVAKLQKGIDSKKEGSKYGANFSTGTHVKQALTPQQLAIIEAGGTVPGAEAPEAATGEPAATDATEGEAAPAATGEATDPGAAAPAATATDLTIEGLSAQVRLLTGQLGEANDKLIATATSLATAQAEATSAKAVSAAMLPVVQKSVGNLRVALGHSAAGVEALSPEALLAEHANLSEQFAGKFRAGGVAAVTPKAADEKKGEQADPIRRARIQATRPQ